MKKLWIIAMMVLVAILVLVSSSRWLRRYERRDCWAFRENANTVVAKDIGGNSWEFYITEDDDFERGFITLLMDDNGTPEEIGDDIVLGYRSQVNY